MSFFQSEPDLVKSLLSTGWNLATGNQTEPANISPTVLDVAGVAGQLLLDNISPVVSTVGKSLLKGRKNENNSTGLCGKLALSAAGLGLTAGVAKLGLSLLKRRLENNREMGRGKAKKVRKDHLRDLNFKSKTVRKADMGSRRHASKALVGHSSREPVAPLLQLTTLFPNLERSVIGDMLAQNDGNIEDTIDQLLALNVDYECTPAGGNSGDNFLFPPVMNPCSLANSGSPIPPCPECPVCIISLANKRIFQCANGHSICEECKKNPELKNCPTCRQKIVGRASNMEQFLATVYGRV